MKHRDHQPRRTEPRRQSKSITQIFRRTISNNTDPIPFNICEICADNKTFEWILSRGLRFGFIKRVSSAMGNCDQCAEFGRF